MKFWVGITDNAWFDFLSHVKPDEVNFWQPGGKTNFKAIPPGAPFLFKLHSPLNHIAGGGYFLRQSFLPLSLAWDAFEQKNGTTTYEEFSRKIYHYRQKSGKTEKDPIIGCLILVEPFFFDREQWIAVDPDDYRSIVVGKTFDTLTEPGAHLWRQVEERLSSIRARSPLDTQPISQFINPEEVPQFGSEFVTKARLGQGSFRVVVTEAYTRRCAMTGERTLPVLEAAHIKPYSQLGPHSIRNGLLLRSDLHILFDRGYVTVTPDLTIEVSKTIKEEWSNGRDYYRLHGNRLSIVPASASEQPSQDFLEWHNTHVYRG